MNQAFSTIRRYVEHEAQAARVGHRAHRPQPGEAHGVLAVGEALHADDRRLALGEQFLELGTSTSPVNTFAA